MRVVLAGLVLVALGAPAFADGNVVAVLSGRTLTLTGDAGSNWVAFSSGGATDAVTVTPSNGTTLNGAGAATFAKVRSVVFVMGAGADRIDFNSTVKLRGGVKADLGDGNDSIYFAGCQTRGRVAVRCGAGLDLVRTDSSALFHGPVNVKGDAGNDELQFANAQFRNRLHVEGGLDDDHVLLQSVTFTSSARAEVFAGRGLDFVEVLFSTFANDVRLDAGPDLDRVRLAQDTFSLDVSAFGGPGFDDVLSLESGLVFRRFRKFGGFEEGVPE
jgi:hypothetical protein